MNLTDIANEDFGALSLIAREFLISVGILTEFNPRICIHVLTSRTLHRYQNLLASVPAMTSCMTTLSKPHLAHIKPLYYHLSFPTCVLQNVVIRIETNSNFYRFVLLL